MTALRLIVSFLTLFWAVSASPLNETEPRASCTVTSYNQVASAIAGCTNIVINGISVPAGKTLDLNLKDGTKLTFQGHITFGHSQWAGPLVRLRGKKVTVQGAAGHKLDGQGTLYWDGLGGSGTKKPVFFRVEASGGSVVSKINLLNCPIRCTSIGASDLTLDSWNIDCSAGDTKGGHNTDGFDISSSNNVVIKNSIVKNQDDCVAVNYGSNLHFSKLQCSGSHGLSLSVGMSKTNPAANVVKNVTFADCTVSNSANAIHIKTHSDAASGSITDVTYQNIVISGITKYAINVQEDYANGGSTGTAKGNIPIKNLKIIGVKGTMSGKNSMPVYILCGTKGCANWSWSGISISGAHKSSSCNFKPSGFSC